MINLERLREFPVIALDVETTGLHWYRDKMFGVALAVYDGQKVESQYWDIREKERILRAIDAELSKYEGIVVNHNIKIDCHFLMNEGVRVPLSRIQCTGVRAGLINEHEGEHGYDGFDLGRLCKKYIGEDKVDIWGELSKLFGGAPTKGVQIKNLHRAPSSLAEKYAAPDPALALKLWLWQEKEIEKQGLQKIWDLERALTPILVEIERQGVRVDEELTRKRSIEVNDRIAKAQRALNELAGKEVNPQSPPQMRALFGVEGRKITVGDQERTQWFIKSGEREFICESTDGGVASIDKDLLMVMAPFDKRAGAITAIRKLQRGKQFLDNHILGHAVKGRVYPNYNQVKGEKGTVTGRFSIDDPALQQIPMHDRDVAEIIRPCFLPEPGEEWACADWKQFEFRWFAHYVKDPAILKMYADNPEADFHQTTADLTGITRDRKYAGDTANAKQINLGLVFGMGEGEMAYNMGMEYEQRVDRNGREWKVAGTKAKEIFAKYHNAIPGVRTLLQQASSIARSRGYIKTVMERHIRFPGGKFVHKAGGLTFQGSAADCMKLKMVTLWPLCKKEGWRYLLTVHDEHDLSIPPAKRKAGAEAKLRKVLETFDGVECPVYCRVPIRTDINFGVNWWEACK